jgi:hypothetical protein
VIVCRCNVEGECLRKVGHLKGMPTKLSAVGVLVGTLAAIGNGDWVPVCGAGVGDGWLESEPADKQCHCPYSAPRSAKGASFSPCISHPQHHWEQNSPLRYYVLSVSQHMAYHMGSSLHPMM